MRRRVFVVALMIVSAAGIASANPPAATGPEGEWDLGALACAKGVVPGAAAGVKAYRLLDIEWSPGPFPGSKVAVLAGNPKEGMHHTYLQLPADCFIPPHWHSTDEYVTVVSGTILMGIGEKAVRNETKLYGPGAFLMIPAKTPHYAWAKSECVLSQTRSGAMDVNWVNPDDDPTKKANAAPAEKVEKK
jgi:quercetin dioxygenase-like cupin family protein